MGARALANWSLVGQGKRLALPAYARCWHPSRMPSAAERVSGGRFPCGPKTTTGYRLSTLRVGLAGRTGGEYLTHGRAGTGESELDATLAARAGCKGRLANCDGLRDTALGMSTNGSHLQLPPAQVAGFCQRHHIRKLAVFGSALHGDARPDSDLDVLVEFEAGMELELSALLDGRKVDLNTPLCLSRFFRDEVLAEAEPVYAAA